MLDLLTRLRQARFQDLALSVYLPPGPALDRRYYQAALKDLEKEQHGLDKDARCALGREMTRMLVRLINGEQPTSLILPTELVIRDSA